MGISLSVSGRRRPRRPLTRSCACCKLPRRVPAGSVNSESNTPIGTLNCGKPMALIFQARKRRAVILLRGEGFKTQQRKKA